ncbi:MAG: hypothetical protein Q3972_08795 [Corynebacterium sp.]|nr:hypothetical protein [Corynebacterium sp.]
MMAAVAELGYDQLAVQAVMILRQRTYKQYVRIMDRDYGLSSQEARIVAFAGKVFKHKTLGARCAQDGVRVIAAAGIAERARKLKGSWKEPAPGHVHQKQLDYAATLLADIPLTHAQYALNALDKRVNQANKNWEHKERERKEAEYAQRRARILEEEAKAKAKAAAAAMEAAAAEPDMPVTPVAPIAPVAPVMSAVPTTTPPEINPRAKVDMSKATTFDQAQFSEPIGAWRPEDLEAYVVKEREGYNTLVLKGVSDLHATIIRDLMRRTYSQLDPEIQKAPAPVRDGHAAYNVLIKAVRTSSDLSMIRLNVVVDLNLLKTHPEWAIRYKDRWISTEEIADLSASFGEEHALAVTDLDGRVLTHSKGRFAKEIHRIIWDIQMTKCAIPWCDCQTHLEYHHLEDYKNNPRTNLYDVRPICKPHHEELTRHPGNLRLFTDLGTSAWRNPRTGRWTVGLAVSPTSTTLQALGKKHALDPLVPDQYETLKKELIRHTWARLNTDTGGNPWDETA